MILNNAGVQLVQFQQGFIFSLYAVSVMKIFMQRRYKFIFRSSVLSQNKTKQYKTIQNKTKQDKTGQNKTKQYKTRQNKTKQDKT